jgi:hypothetical protein
MTARESLLFEEAKRHAAHVTRRAFEIAAAKMAHIIDLARLDAESEDATAHYKERLARFAQLDEAQAEAELRRFDTDERFQAAEAVHARFRN